MLGVLARGVELVAHGDVELEAWKVIETDGEIKRHR